MNQTIGEWITNEMSYQKDFWISNIPKLHSRQFNSKPFSALCFIFFKAAHLSVLQLVHVQAKVQVKMVAGQWCNYKLSDQFADIYVPCTSGSCISFGVLVLLIISARPQKNGLVGALFLKTRWPVPKVVALVCGLEIGIRIFWKPNLRRILI